MITPDGWLDWADRRPVPIDPATGRMWKTNPGVNTAQIYLPHSAVGEGFQGWFDNIPGSGWAFPTHGWINKREQDGTIQIMPFTARAWASGSGFPNNNGIAFENQGGRTGPGGVFLPGITNEPLTPYQLASNVRIVRELGEWKGRPLEYWARPRSPTDLWATLYEHRECVRFGSLATACPSGRIPWSQFLARLQEQAPPIKEEDEMIMHVTISDAERAGRPFRSYLIGASTAGGFSSKWVESQDGFDAANLICFQETVETITLAQLRTFKPVPDPLAP